MGEYDTARTYALRKLQYALVGPSGQPISLHAEIDGALGAFVKSRGGIILDEDSRQLYFKSLLQAKYKICPAFAWCRVDQEQAILKLKKEKSVGERGRKKADAKRAGKARGDNRNVPRGRKRAKRGKDK